MARHETVKQCRHRLTARGGGAQFRHWALQTAHAGPIAELTGSCAAGPAECDRPHGSSVSGVQVRASVSKNVKFSPARHLGDP